MFDLTSFELAYWHWAVLALCAFLVGVSKTGVPGFGILVVPLMAWVLPTKSSVGVLLPMLIFADIFAAGYYRRHAQWSHIFRLLPWAMAGIVIGYFAMDRISDQQLKPTIGAIVLAMLALRWWQESKKDSGIAAHIPTHWAFAAVLGLLAGVTTMMANAAGPIMIIYLLAMGFDKTKFIGTGAWYFFIVNWLKVPFSTKLDLINTQSLKLDAMMLPFIAVGAVVGILVLKHIPQKVFKVVVQVLAVAAAIKLLF